MENDGVMDFFTGIFWLVVGVITFFLIYEEFSASRSYVFCALSSVFGLMMFLVSWAGFARALSSRNKKKGVGK